MSSWADISELSKQLKQVQSENVGFKIQDRTWVDIINQTLKLLPEFKLIPCLDGRTYLTEKQLISEINDEIEAHDGRISIFELETLLNVDSSYIESNFHKLNDDEEISKVTICFSDLVNDEYLFNISLAIKDVLEDKGFIEIGEIMRVHNLSLNISTQIMESSKYGIRTRKENEIYYTDEFINVNKSRVRGLLTACLIPLQISKLSTKIGISERLIVNIIDSLLSSGDLCGSYGPGKSNYLPYCFTSSQSSYIQNFYRDNGFVEFSILRKFGINDPSSFCKNQIQGGLIFGETIINESLLFQIQNGVEEGLNDQSWLDTTSYFPIGFKSQDAELILLDMIKDKPVEVLYGGTFLCTKALLNSCISICDGLMKNLSVKVASDNSKLVKKLKLEAQASLEKRGQKSVLNTKNLSVGGHGGRELKIKNTKKKYHTSKQSKQMIDSDQEEFEEVSFDLSTYLISDSVIAEIKNKAGVELPEDLIICIEEIIRPDLLQKLTTYAQSVVLQNSETAARKQDLTKVSEELNSSIQAIFAYEQGFEKFGDFQSLREKLLNHLIKTQCTRILNITLIHLANFYSLNLDQKPTASTSIVESKAKPVPKSKRSKKSKKNDTWSSHEDSAHVPAQVTLDKSTDDSSDNGYVKIQAIDVENVKSELLDSEKMTPELRNRIVDNISLINKPEIQRLSSELNQLCQIVKSNQTFESKPIEKFLNLLEYAAVDCLGMQIPFLFQQDFKKKIKEARNMSSNLLIQIESQFSDAISQKDQNFVNSCAQLSLTSACILAQVLCEGWPICATGKLVPDLAKWISITLRNGRSNLGTKFLTEKHADEALLKLTDSIIALVKGDREHELMELVDQQIQLLNSIIPQCKKFVSGQK